MQIGGNPYYSFETNLHRHNFFDDPQLHLNVTAYDRCVLSGVILKCYDYHAVLNFIISHWRCSQWTRQMSAPTWNCLQHQLIVLGCWRWKCPGSTTYCVVVVSHHLHPHPPLRLLPRRLWADPVLLL